MLVIAMIFYMAVGDGVLAAREQAGEIFTWWGGFKVIMTWPSMIGLLLYRAAVRSYDQPGVSGDGL